ncbi:serine/threonine-protein phosphatase 1 regulatory subunit 10 [Chrysoperla carnea]|uniref:serine/threonine-protein phosphatase 1 regulatory subunit 10 n=1 Tax=Chrysoperla carnea TaxID=189513 RepID=UPI001D091395|nr:serine/threonine-protein phosphatase 1 regulatory subunit 10 [Chrysoperla carnea]XP_044743817.1 serine/threonine-protein phosphatase 1 regulatory subunit 10 [Chrysoperla carnea]
MPRIDPQQLLSCLGVLLNSNGGIRSKDEVVRLASLMTKYSKNLVSKCVYILILKNTDTELLGRFMSAGGWNLTHVWLTNGIMNKNWALVGELLELMLMCPVDVERLKANNCPKLVKGLSKEGGPEGVRVLASKLVEQWLKVVKGETQQVSNNCILNASSYQSTNSCVQLPQTISSSSNTSSTTINEPSETQTERVEVIETSSFETITTQSETVVDNNSSITTEPASNVIIDQAVDQNVEVESSPPVYKISFRDGKQVIAKVDETSSDAPPSSETKPEKEKSHSSSSNSSRDKDKDKKHLSSKHSSKSSSSSSSSSRKSSSSSSSHRDKSRDKDRDRDRDKDKSKDKDRKESRDKDKDRSKHKVNGTHSSSSKSSSSSSKENKEKQAEKDKATLAKLQPLSLSKLGKIPKKSSEDDKKDKKIADPPPKVEVKKPSISIENRKHNSESRPKTVKVFNAKMRSTGLEEEVKPPPPRPVQRSKIPPPKRASPPKDIIKDISVSHPPEKRPKIVDLVNGDIPPERPGGIKLIAPKPKPVGLQECGLFMDAMVAASTKKEPKKRKRRMSVTKEDGAPGGKTNSPPNSPTTKTEKPPTSPTQLQPTAPKFYKDTLEDEPEVKSENKEDKSDSSVEIKTEKADNKDKEKEESDKSEKVVDAFVSSPDIKIEEELLDTSFSKMKDEFKIPGGVLVYHKKSGPKKSVKWKEDACLEQIQYFELDETERVNVTKTFTDMKQIEMSGEREALQMSRKLPNEDLMDERTRWRPLIPIDLAPDLAVLGKKSKEKDIQYAREKVILQALYFHKSMIPDSPTEPDVEHHPMEDPVIIPLDDVAGNPDNIKDFTSTPWPESKGELPRAQAPPPVAPFPPIQPNFMNVGGPNAFPPFANQANFIEPPMMGGGGGTGGGDWRTGDGRVMGPVPNDMGPMGPPPPNMFGPPMGGMPPPNMFHGPGPDGFNMIPNLNNMNGPFPPGPPVNFQGGPGPGPGMFNDSGFQGRGGGNMRGRGRGGFDRFNNGPPNNWKGGGGGGKNWMNRGICKHFQKGGYCRQGDKCQFLHPGVNCPPF